MNNILLICPDTPERTLALTPALSILKRNFPRAQISVISAYPWLFKNNSAVFKTMPIMGISKLYPLLKEEKYDLLILTKPIFKYAFAAFMAGIKRRIMPYSPFTALFAGTSVKIDGKSKAQDINIALLKPLFIYFFPAKSQLFIDKAEDNAALDLLKEAGISPKEKFVCMFPGASAPHLNCGKEFYAKLNDKTALKHKELKVLLVAADKQSSHTVNEIFWLCIKKPAVIRTAPDIAVLSAIIARSEGIIGGCGLPAHLAAALGKKAIVFAPLKAEEFLDMPAPVSALIKPKEQQCESSCLGDCRAFCLKEISLTQTCEVFDTIFAQKSKKNKGIFNEERTVGLFNNKTRRKKS